MQLSRATHAFVSLSLVILAWCPVSYGQDGAGATEAIAAMRAASAAPVSGVGQQAGTGGWAQALLAVQSTEKPEPAQPAQKTLSRDGQLGGIFLGFVGLLLALAGGAAGWFAGRQREYEGLSAILSEIEANRPEPPPLPSFPEWPQPPVSHINLTAYRQVEGHGQLVAADVDGRSLLLFFTEGFDSATLVAQLDSPPEGGFQLDALSERVILAMRAGQPAQAAAVAHAIPRVPVAEPSPRPPGLMKILMSCLTTYLAR